MVHQRAFQGDRGSCSSSLIIPFIRSCELAILFCSKIQV